MKFLPIFLFLCSISIFGQTFGKGDLILRKPQPMTTPTPETAPSQKPAFDPSPLQDLQKLPPKKANSSVARPPENICKACTFSSFDKVTGETSVIAKSIIVSTDKRSGFIVQSYRFASGNILVNFQLVGTVGCIDDHAETQILFRDGTRLKTQSGNSHLECDGYVPFYDFSNEELFTNLETKMVETVRIFTVSSSLTEDFSENESRQLMNEIACLRSIK